MCRLLLDDGLKAACTAFRVGGAGCFFKFAANLSPLAWERVRARAFSDGANFNFCMALRCRHIHITRHPPPVAQAIAETAKPMFCPAFHPCHKTQKQPASICKPKPKIQNPKSKTKCRLLSNRRPKAACTSFHLPDAFTAPYSPVRNESLRGCGWPRPPAPLWVRAPKFPARSKAHTT